MFYWSFTSLVHFGHPQFLILAPSMAGARNYAKRIHTLYNSVLLADFSILWRYYAPPLIGGALSDAFV